MQINRQTYEEYFLLYLDGELTAEERSAVERFVEENPEVREEFSLLGGSVFTADENIVFENKEVLYRQEKEAAVIPMNTAGKSYFLSGWRKIAAAVILLLLGAGGWLYLTNTSRIQKGNTGIALVKPSAADTSKKQHTLVRLPAVPKNDQDDKLLVKNISRPRTHVKKVDPVQVKIKEKLVDDDNQENISLPEAATFLQEPAMTDQAKNEISIPVQARSLMPPAIPVKQDHIHYADEEDAGNKIYFANTSFSKKNNLRVVFRKASRIIDRITTLQ